MFLSVCRVTAERFPESIRFVLSFYFFSTKKSGRKEEAGQKGSYNTTEIKVQKEGRSVWVTNVHFLQYNSTKKMRFRDVLQEMHGKKLRGRSKENSSNLPQTEVNPNLCWIMTTGQPAIRP